MERLQFDSIQFYLFTPPPPFMPAASWSGGSFGGKCVKFVRFASLITHYTIMVTLRLLGYTVILLGVGGWGGAWQKSKCLCGNVIDGWSSRLCAAAHPWGLRCCSMNFQPRGCHTWHTKSSKTTFFCSRIVNMRATVRSVWVDLAPLFTGKHEDDI